MPDRCLYRRAAISSWDETHSIRSRSPLRAASQEDKAVGEPATSDLSAGRPCQRGCRVQLSRADRGRGSARSSTSHVLVPRTRNSDRPGPPRRFGMRTQPPQENVTDDNALRPSARSTHVCTRKPPRAINCSCRVMHLQGRPCTVDRRLLTMSATRPPQNKMIFLTFLQAVSRLTSWSVCMPRGGGGTKRVSLLLSNPRDLCQGTASHWRNAQPTTLFAAKCVPTSAERSSLWTVMPCRTHVPHLHRHVVNVSPSIDILHHS